MNNNKINILIVHYNTPSLTECLVKSINKYVGANCSIYIFDNSDKNPFIYKQDNITIFDNTKGQIINFEKWLSVYKKKPSVATPDKGRRISARHCFTVDKCFDLINDNFILLDSDVLLTSDISELFDENCAFVGQLEKNNVGIDRLVPYCCFINVKLCKSIGVRYYDENKMHGISVGSGNAYDTGAAFYYHLKNKKYKLVNLNNYIVHYKGASWDPNYVNNIKYHVNLTIQEWLYKYREHYSIKTKNKRVVYTCITGQYDKLFSPSYIQDDVDYVCFTDNLNQNNDIWELRPIPDELINLNKVKQQRIIKICPHRYLSEYEDSIWIDGSIDILSNVNTFIKEYCSDNKQVFIRKHPSRTCIYDEARVCMSMKKDTKEHIDKQINKYKIEKFPKNYGLVESGIIYRKHNTEYSIQLMEMWAKEIEIGSHRDQLSFNYVLWKFGDHGFKYIDMSISNGKYFKWYPKHNRQKSTKLLTVNTPISETIKLNNIHKNTVKSSTPMHITKVAHKPKHIIKKTRVFLGTGLNWH